MKTKSIAKSSVLLALSLVVLSGIVAGCTQKTEEPTKASGYVDAPATKSNKPRPGAPAAAPQGGAMKVD